MSKSKQVTHLMVDIPRTGEPPGILGPMKRNHIGPPKTILPNFQILFLWPLLVTGPTPLPHTAPLT